MDTEIHRKKSETFPLLRPFRQGLNLRNTIFSGSLIFDDIIECVSALLSCGLTAESSHTSILGDPAIKSQDDAKKRSCFKYDMQLSITLLIEQTQTG